MPTPAFSTALSFFDGYRTARLPANLLQARADAAEPPARAARPCRPLPLQPPWRLLGSARLTPRLPSPIVSQAQRDYFGAHTFERLGAPGVWEHANWTGTTGRVVASTYNA